jgi:hypothetical protein
MARPAEQPHLAGDGLHAEVALPLPPPAAVVVALPRASRRPRSRTALAGLDRIELAVVGAFVAISMYVVVLNLLYAALHHLTWTGVDGQYPTDQLQYLAWVHDAARHLLASDLFTLRPTPHDYLQPVVAVSGGLVAAGVAPWVALLVWKPVALAAIVLVVRAYIHRLIPPGWSRRAALLLALFAASIQPLGNEWLPFEAWGYPFDLLAVAALVAALLAYDRSVRENRALSAAPLWGGLASWLHPWQGETLIFLVLATELARLFTLRPRRVALDLRRRLARPLLTLAAACLPLAYYAGLDHFDPAWHMGRTALEQPWPLGRLLLPLIPLIVAAAPAYARRPRGFLAAATRIWPLAALLTWGMNQTGIGAWSVYGWLGITLPLGILAAESLGAWDFGRPRVRRLLAVLVVGALTLPGSISLMAAARSDIAPSTGNPNLISASEARALAYLTRDPAPGGVLASFQTGDLIPGETGRRTYVGDTRWSGDYVHRARAAWGLLHGSMSPGAARAFIRRTGARFVLGDCNSPSLATTLRPMIASIHRFGCETLYVIR